MQSPGTSGIGAIRADWAARGYSCGLWTDPPGTRWEGYVHDSDELFMVLEGEVELKLGERTFRPAIGAEILITCGVVHSVRNVGTTNSRWLYGYN
jgi:cupin 2 domain-containing protein